MYMYTKYMITLTWNRIFAMTSQCGWLNVSNSFITLVRISFGGTRSVVSWHNTSPYRRAVSTVAIFMRLNRTSIFSVDWTIISGSSWTMPLDRSVFSNCSAEPAGWMIIRMDLSSAMRLSVILVCLYKCQNEFSYTHIDGKFLNSLSNHNAVCKRCRHLLTSISR